MPDTVTRHLFTTDQGGPYEVIAWPGGDTYVHGLRTKVTYRSTAHRVEVTGPATRRHYVERVEAREVVRLGIRGNRAVLHLDTGEGVSALRGVLHG